MLLTPTTVEYRYLWVYDETYRQCVLLAAICRAPQPGTVLSKIDSSYQSPLPKNNEIIVATRVGNCSDQTQLRLAQNRPLRPDGNKWRCNAPCDVVTPRTAHPARHEHSFLAHLNPGWKMINNFILVGSINATTAICRAMPY